MCAVGLRRIISGSWGGGIVAEIRSEFIGTRGGDVHNIPLDTSSGYSAGA